MRAETLGLQEPLCATSTGHRPWGPMTVELEMAELLYSLTRYAKPSVVVECGTGEGVSTQAISTALHHNGCGTVHSWEPIVELYEQAARMFSGRPNVVVHHGNSRDCDLNPDLVFVDSGGGAHVRNPTIAHWLRHHACPLVVVHDASRGYEALDLGEGVYIPGWDGVWIGRAAPNPF